MLGATFDPHKVSDAVLLETLRGYVIPGRTFLNWYVQECRLVG
jgi:hypothetical protein